MKKDKNDFFREVLVVVQTMETVPRYFSGSLGMVYL
jgi:hypothetical protein